MSNNIVWHSHPVDREVRSKQKLQSPLVIWFTGLSASGKSTIAGALEQILTQQNYHTYLLDGDNLRHGLCTDLGFSDQDRQENIRRVGEVAKLMADAGLIAVASQGRHRYYRLAAPDVAVTGKPDGNRSTHGRYPYPTRTA